MDAILWIVLPVLVAAGSAILSFFVMQSRMEVAVAKERGSITGPLRANFRGPTRRGGWGGIGIGVGR
jgi:hypothetical protein